VIKFIDGLSYTTSQNVNNQEEVPLPSLSPIPFIKCRHAYSGCIVRPLYISNFWCNNQEMYLLFQTGRLLVSYMISITTKSFIWKVMACHNPPLKTVNKQEDMPLPFPNSKMSHIWLRKFLSSLCKLWHEGTLWTGNITSSCAQFPWKWTWHIFIAIYGYI